MGEAFPNGNWKAEKSRFRSGLYHSSGLIWTFRPFVWEMDASSNGKSQILSHFSPIWPQLHPVTYGVNPVLKLSVLYCNLLSIVLDWTVRTGLCFSVPVLYSANMFEDDHL